LRFATHPSVSVNESNERFRHLGGLHRALGINGKRSRAAISAAQTLRMSMPGGAATSFRASWLSTSLPRLGSGAGYAAVSLVRLR
jgi:hypothetical protein